MIASRSLLGPTFAAVAVAVALAPAACTAFDPNATTEVTGPSYDQFKELASTADGGVQAGVSIVLERRCGTLDCHGQIARPLRIYGQYGLRIADAGNVPGVQPTTDAEHQANYQAVINLQPELMNQVVQGAASPDALMLLRKPLQIERHKGGPVFVSGDDGSSCLMTWLQGQANFALCAAAIGD